MVYNYRNGLEGRSRRNKWVVIGATVLLLGGGYLLVTSLSPLLPPSMTGETEAITKKLKTEQPKLTQNRLYIPQIGVDVAIVTGVTEQTLEGGAWHRNPQLGDPKKGNNFILAAHRFNLGFTPTQTRAKSPFFYLDRLSSGQKVYVDYEGQRYAYEITKHYKVGDSDLSIEAATTDARLTLYTCDLRGPKAGREVVEAKPIGTVAWNSGKPQIQSHF